MCCKMCCGVLGRGVLCENGDVLYLFGDGCVVGVLDCYLLVGIVFLCVICCCV